MTTSRKAALTPAQELGYELGATYRDGYWQDTHTIVSEHRNPLGWPMVTSRWSDGHCTTHCTRLDVKRDRKVS